MAWIKTVDEKEASGVLAAIYDGARRRAGRVFNILRVQSLNPPVLQASVQLYRETTLAESPLSRGLREMIAVVVSRSNDCHY
ncbi:MAG: carboxymuconolactone decarboxylase family protein [Phycisphaerales bacterium]|nr:MAG: carboxymuconolactone decarboxylase family protein [Phycisphaerales bacterium]